MQWKSMFVMRTKKLTNLNFTHIQILKFEVIILNKPVL